MSTPKMHLSIVVPDVAEASGFYQRIGFTEEFTLPSPGGGLAMAWLTFGGTALILGPLDEPHYGSPERAELVRRGPRGLGVTLILEVAGDLERLYDLVRGDGLEVLVEPVDEYYGDRVFFFLDPYGYEWKVQQQVEEVSDEEVARRATQGWSG